MGDSFAQILNDADQLSTPYVPAPGSAASETAAYDHNHVWLPADVMPSDPPPGFETTPQGLMPTPTISAKAQAMWDTVKSDAQGVAAWGEDEAKNVYGGVKNVAKTVYGDLSKAAGTVYDDVAKPVKGLLTGTYMYMLLGVIVVAGAVYFIGKSGAIGQAAGAARV